MEFKVFDRTVERQTVYLKLRENSDKTIDLLAVDGDGRVLTTILWLDSNGMIRRNNCVSPTLGFEIDEFGRIIIL